MMWKWTVGKVDKNSINLFGPFDNPVKYVKKHGLGLEPEDPFPFILK